MFIIFVALLNKSNTYPIVMNLKPVILQVVMFFAFAMTLPGQFHGIPVRPGPVKWIDDNRLLLNTINTEGRQVTTDYNCKTGKSVVVTDYRSDIQKLLDLLPGGTGKGNDMTFSDDMQAVVITRDNDLWYYSVADRSGRRLTDDPAREMNVRFAPGGLKIAYTKNKDLFACDIDKGIETRLTFDANERIYNGWASWVYYEEILGRSSKYAAFWWSPDGEHIAYLHSDDNPVPLYYLNALGETDGTYGRLEITPYPKAGEPNPKVKMGIVGVSTAGTVWVRTDTDVDQYIAWPSWTSDGSRLLIQVVNRDQNDIRFILADASTGDYTEVYHETRPTWVDFFEDVYIMKDNTGFIIRSCRNDWYNLYYYGWDGTLKSQITNFSWKVSEIVKVDELKGEIYFNGTGPDCLEIHLFRARLDGTGLQQLTSGEGFHSVSVSPGGSWIVDTWSNISDPGGIDLINRKGKVVRAISRQDIPEFDAALQQRQEIVRIKTSDGLFDLPALITYPVSFDPAEKHPVVFTIYGGPDDNRVRNRWSGNVPDWYAANGIVTIRVEHRGSGVFGKRGLDYMYRSLGKWEMSDYSDAVKWLRQQTWVDSSRMGITGASYGGYVTCMAMTAGADYWTHGIADYSATDWRLYDNVYTERYMDTPEENPEGYRNGSVLTYAHQLKGKFLIRHGDMDDNVHMQNTIWLVTALQDLNKPFEMMIYPGERHGVGGPKREFMTNEAHNFWLKNFFGKDDQ
jgi:dipeptidyl-peptidase-4